MQINAMIKRKPSINSILIHLLFIVISISFIYPILLIVSISFSDMKSIVENGYQLIPERFSISAYKFVFASPGRIINSYIVTIVTTTLGTIFSLLITSLLAYAISRQDYIFRGKLSMFILFTMLFNGGMVPWYMLITNYLYLKNTIWVLILPYVVNAWNVFMLRTFFQGVPAEMVEAAEIDGSTELRTFFTIMIPMSKPALAAIGFLIMLRYWNDWWLSMLFIDKGNLYTLQYMIYDIMNKINEILQDYNAAAMSIEDLPSETVRMATVFLACGPMLFIFPFFQKHFVKGLTVGAVKG